MSGDVRFRAEEPHGQEYEIGRLLLRGTLATRDNALASNAPEFADMLWAQAEQAIKRAGNKIEAGDQNGARKEAAKAERLYADAEFEAIRTSVLGPTQRLRQEATQLKADRLPAYTSSKGQCQRTPGAKDCGLKEQWIVPIRAPAGLDRSLCYVILRRMIARRAWLFQPDGLASGVTGERGRPKMSRPPWL